MKFIFHPLFIFSDSFSRMGGVGGNHASHPLWDGSLMLVDSVADDYINVIIQLVNLYRLSTIQILKLIANR